MKKNPNEIYMNEKGQTKDAYYQAKIERINILIDNSTNQLIKDYYNEVKLAYLKLLPKKILKQKKDETEKEIEENTEAIDAAIIESEKIATTVIKEAKLEIVDELTSKKDKLLQELAELNLSMNKGKIPCEICGAILKDPTNEQHITSKQHQEALNKRGLQEDL